MSAYVVTYYSFKGGVGRSTLLAQTAFRLAAMGRTVLIWDLDLEAPGLHLMPDLKPEKIPAKGFLEWLTGWQKNPLAPLPEKSLKALRKTIAAVPTQRNLSIIPAFGKDANFANLYAGIDWHRWLEAEPDSGIALFRSLIDALSEDCDYLLIDSRTGISNLGGWLAAVLPHATVLVAGYGEQNTLGAAHIFEVLEEAREGKMAERIAGHNNAGVKLRQLLVASPVPLHNPDKLASRREVWKSRFGSPPLVEIPFDPELLLLETMNSVSTMPEMDAAYGLVVEQLEAFRSKWEFATRSSEKGVTFEERMARLLELNGFKVERKRIVDGNRVDLLARIQAGWNKEIVYLVKCKDYQKPAPKSDLEKLCTWLNGDDARDMRAEGMFIASDYSPAARSFAESQPHLTLITPRELEIKLFDFRPYLAGVVGEYENSALFKTYVHQRIRRKSPNSEPVEDALEYALDWVAGAGQRLWLMLGDYGTGKSVLMRRLAYELAKHALAPQAGEEEPVIPVFIDLKHRHHAFSLENLLFEHFAQVADTRGLNPAVLLYLLEAGRIVLLLDSFDEIGLTTVGRTLEQQFRMLAYPAGKTPLASGGNRVLISCRTHFFRDQQQVKACVDEPGDSLVSADSTLGRAARSFDAAIDELELFDAGQVAEFLRRHLGESAATEMQRFINKIYDLPNLAPYPILLDMMVEFMPGLKRGSGAVTSTTLYSAYTRTWLEDRSGGQLLSTPEQRRIALEHLAQCLWRRPEQCIHYSELVGELRALPAQLLAGLELTRLDLELRTAAFLVRNSEGQYRFSHQSFLEYFYARRLLRAVDEGALALAALLDSLPPPSPECAAFLVDLARDGSSADPRARLFTLLRDILSAHYQPRVSENALHLLLDAIRHVIGDGNPPDEGRAVLKKWLPQPLKMPGAQLAGFDLRGAWLEKADFVAANLEGALLNGAQLGKAQMEHTNLAHADLSAANMQKVDLKNADLSDTNLNGADLSGAELSGASLRFARLLEARLDSAKVKDADFSYARLAGARLDGVSFDDMCLLTAPRATPAKKTVGWPLAKSGPVSPVPPYLLTGHLDRVHSVAFSPCGKFIATASNDKTARLWDTATGREIRRFEGHDNRITSVAFSPDGNTIATASGDNTARLWDAKTGAEIRRFEGHSDCVRSVAFYPDGNIVATASNDKTARLWDVNTGAEIRCLEGHGSEVWCVAFSPDCKTIATASDDKTARLWDAATGREIRCLAGHGSSVLSVAFSSDGRFVATASDDKTARLWEVNTGAEIRIFEGHGNRVLSAAFSLDGNTFATASSDNSARLWDIATGREIRRLEGHSDWVRSVVFSQGGNTVATASDDETARLWDAATGREIRRFEGYGSGVLCVAFSPYGNALVTASSDNTARLWDAATGREIRRLEGHSGWVRSVAFSPDGKTVATASEDNSARLWDAATGREIRRLEGYGSSVLSVAFSPDGNTIATASYDKTARLWDAATGREIRRLEGHSDWVRSVAFSADGKTVSTASDDETARLWDVATGREIRRLEGHGSGVLCVAFSPYGNTLATASYDKTARLWDGATGQEIRLLEGHSGWVRSVAFSPDGNTLATASEDNSARLWDVATGREVHRLEGHSDWVWSVAFSPDGNTLATASYDKTARLWDTGSGKLLAELFPSRDGWMSWRYDQTGYRSDAGGRETFWIIDPKNPERLWHPADLLDEFDLDRREKAVS